MELGDSFGRVEERIEDPERYGNPIGRPTESTNLDPWELSEMEPPIKTHRDWNEALGTYVNRCAAQSPCRFPKN